MANKERGEVSLTVDGKTYTLRATHNSMAEAEEYLGRSIFEVNGGGVRFVRALLLSLVQGQHGITMLEQAGDLIEIDPVEVTRAVNEATSLFFLRYKTEKKETASPSPGAS